MGKNQSKHNNPNEANTIEHNFKCEDDQYKTENKNLFFNQVYFLKLFF